MADTPLSLLERLRTQGDADLWRRLAALYEPLLRGWLGRQGVQDADQDDLVQEVLLVLARELPGFRHNGRAGAFRAWLRTILVHRLRDFWRSRQRRPASPAEALDQLADPASELSRRWDEEHDRHLARQLLRELEPRFAQTTWQAFRRVVLDEVPTDVVAAELGITPNAVCIAKSRVLSRLRQEGRGLLD
jgi:RNA polymerase sigma-70 factor (ECF subfamily)